MLRTITVDNYRGLKHIEIEDLGRICLLTGPNNLGKSSLLEAIILCLSGPNAPFKAFSFELMRGLNPPQIPVVTTSGPNGLFPQMWLSEFRDFDSSTPIVLKVVTDDGHSREVKVSSDPGESRSQIEFNSTGSFTATQTFATVTAELTEDDAEPRTWTHTNTGGVQVQTTPALPEPWSGVYLTSLGTPAREVQELNDKFSEIVKHGEKADLIKQLQIIDERIQGIDILQYNDQSLIHVSFSDSTAPIPIHLTGSATASLFNLMVSMYRVRNGVMCVDEIFAGVHYTRLKTLFTWVVGAAVKFNVQLIATTHSMETIIAAYDATEDEHDLSVYQFASINDEISVFRYDFDSIDAAKALNQDLR